MNTNEHKDEEKLQGNDSDLIVAFEDVNEERYIRLKCCFDGEKMSKRDIIVCKGSSNKIMALPIYECSTCGRRYTSSEKYANREKININDILYINLSPDRNGADYKGLNSVKVKRLIKAHFYIVNKKIKKCMNNNCSSRLLENIAVELENKKGNKKIQIIKKCMQCNAYYFPIGLLDVYELPYDIINQNEVSTIRKEYQIKREEKAKKKQERKRRRAEREALKKRKQEEVKKKKQSQKSELSNGEHIPKWLREARKNCLVEPNKNLKIGRVIKKETIEQISKINYEDFVVRRSVFKCMHNNHNVMDIEANVNIIDKENRERSIKINAGYCPECRVYFILESTYAYLKRLGIILCRISDEKYFFNSTNNSTLKLAKESLLMQYGYNVSKEKGLSELTRHKILAILIDLQIMSKNEIISYLDFFINQRQSKSMYQLAISKWETDRAFVENYKRGKYKQIGVLGLHH